ncbi:MULTISPECIES: hypothetical protein [unclassified Gilliamella]|nr:MULTISPECIES: hypothetical protein [unclassified Gilliamella]
MLTNEYILLSTEYFLALVNCEATIPDDVSLSSIIQQYLHKSKL